MRTFQQQTPKNKRWLKYFLLFSILATMMWFVTWNKFNNSEINTIIPLNQFEPLTGDQISSRFIPSGWDQAAKQIYYDRVSTIQMDLLNNSNSVKKINIAPFSSHITVYDSEFTRVWDRLNNKFPLQWEPETYSIYLQHINSDTILIDFGTWIGVTLLYGAQFAYKSYGIEADPAAFAEVQMNIKLNQNNIWSKNVHIHAGGVSTADDSGSLTMQSYQPGNSCSGFGDEVACHKAGVKTPYQWEVGCHTLNFYLQKWGVWHEVYKNGKNIFIKIDVESYECSLVPDFYEWLIQIPGKQYLPTFYISYHPQIQKCSDDQYMKLTLIVKLYSFLKCGIKLNETITIEHLNRKTLYAQIIRCNDNGQSSVFVLFN